MNKDKDSTNGDQSSETSSPRKISILKDLTEESAPTTSSSSSSPRTSAAATAVEETSSSSHQQPGASQKTSPGRLKVAVEEVIDQNREQGVTKKIGSIKDMFNKPNSSSEMSNVVVGAVAKKRPSWMKPSADEGDKDDASDNNTSGAAVNSNKKPGKIVIRKHSSNPESQSSSNTSEDNQERSAEPKVGIESEVIEAETDKSTTLMNRDRSPVMKHPSHHHQNSSRTQELAYMAGTDKADVDAGVGGSSSNSSKLSKKVELAYMAGRKVNEVAVDILQPPPPPNSSTGGSPTSSSSSSSFSSSSSSASSSYSSASSSVPFNVMNTQVVVDNSVPSFSPASSTGQGSDKVTTASGGSPSEPLHVPPHPSKLRSVVIKSKPKVFGGADIDKVPSRYFHFIYV
jgi:hypothetical protein